MSAYYNEIDPFAAQWLRELIKAGHIAPGEVDTRSIENVAADDLAGFTQCHFFAGIGTWSYALYRLTWKQRTTPAGRSIPALRASVPRTSDKGCTGWPTPTGNSYTGAGSGNREGGLNLQTAVELSGWPTPRSAEAGHSTGNPARAFNSKSRLEDIVFLTGWVTPSARGWKDTPGMAAERLDGRNRTDQLPRRAATTYPCRLTVSGKMLTGFCAGMESGGQLNPALARWLMGLPPEWDDCAAMVTPSSRRRWKSL